MPDSSRRDVIISTILSKPRDVLTSAAVVSIRRVSSWRNGGEPPAAESEPSGESPPAESESDDE